ncbi:uncharacterized protein BJ171DRAFT_600722 [Polychytrium aggregatum]|uniref:uncharacterized protein n=1 Tax=Polychytrium aggregatum TaxID=110093 RepID=UPI0022FDB4DC|nr:uncharacterized protein BJ171DRAFT_600722 [Polychytrium aggregatum]KAI9202717.1 hypothetical protein BJ171DRAFT_600722 [Polychytrium aggregatum]
MSTTGDNGALIAVGVLVAALQKGIKGGALAENQPSVAISLLGYHAPGVEEIIPSADCGIFHRGLSKFERLTVLGWLNESGILCSIHKKPPPISDSSDESAEKLKAAENQMGRWAHATFGMLGYVPEVNPEESKKSSSARQGQEPPLSADPATDTIIITTAAATPSAPASDKSVTEFLKGLTSDNENKYMICKYKESIRSLSRQELIDLVEGLWERALDQCKGTADKKKHPIDVWGQRLVRDLCNWDGSAQKPTSEPDLVWRANKRAISALSSSILSLSRDQIAGLDSNSYKGLKEKLIRCLVTDDDRTTYALPTPSASPIPSSAYLSPQLPPETLSLPPPQLPSIQNSSTPGALRTETPEDRVLHKVIHAGDITSFSSDLLRHYTAYKAAKHTLKTLDLATAAKSQSAAAAAKFDRYCVVSGYSRDSLSNLMTSLAVLDTVNNLKSAHAEHSGDAGPFSIKRTYEWYEGVFRSLIEIVIAVVLTAVLGMGPLVSMSTSRLLLVRAGFFPKGAPCAAHFIEEAEVYSVGSGRDEWWALIKVRPAWRANLQIIVMSIIEVAAVIVVWAFTKNKHVAIGFDYVCKNPSFNFWLPQAIGGIIAFFTVIVGCAMIAPKWVREKLKDLYFYEEKHTIAVEDNSQNNEAADDKDKHGQTKPTEQPPVPDAADPASKTSPENKVYSRSIKKDYDGQSIYEVLYCIICWIIAGVIVYFAFFTTYKFYQDVYEYSALILWALGEAMNPHMRKGRNIVTHEVMAYIMVFVSLLVGASCDYRPASTTLLPK